MKIVGVGHLDASKIAQKLVTKSLNVILLPGIGDIIYTWYKLIHYVNDGYTFNVKVLDCHPQRSHQIMGCLEGMKSFEYIKGFEYYSYWLQNIEDLRFPPLSSTFKNMPVIHINSFLETNRNINEFMPKHPAKYDIKIITNDESAVQWAQEKTKDNYNILLYTSSYTNNINCNVHPDPQYWVDMALLAYEFGGSDKPLKVFVTGASYDSDLTEDTYKRLKELNIKTELLLDQHFYKIIEIIRNVNFLVSYESGLAMIADVFHTPLFHVIRYQGGDRDDKRFPFLGPINPDGIWKRYWPIFYDENLDDIRHKINM
jgi:hypothetical protein